MSIYTFRISAEVEADDENDAIKKIVAGQDYTNIDIEDGPDEQESIEEEEDEVKE